MAPNIDPVDDTDEEEDGPCPVPDDDGNVVLRVPIKRKEATDGRRRNHKAGEASGANVPRRPRANPRKATRKGK